METRYDLIEKMNYFDEIAEVFYDVIPEEERLIIDCLQSKIRCSF